jgi:hypothetical protein
MLYYYNIFIIFDIGWSVPGGQYNRRISTSQILGCNLRCAITITRCCAASLKTTRFCRNMYPLLRRAVLKHYPLSVELRIHSTSSSSTSNGGTLQTTLTLCFLAKFSFVSNIDDTRISTNQFHHFSFIWNRKSYKFRILLLRSISKYYSHLSLQSTQQ